MLAITCAIYIHTSVRTSYVSNIELATVEYYLMQWSTVTTCNQNMFGLLFLFDSVDNWSVC